MTIYSLDVLLFLFGTCPCPLLTVASWPVYRFLKRQVRWSGIPISFRIFQFIVIHTVKGFGIVNKAERDVFLELSCFFADPVDVGNLISGSSALSKTSLNIWKFTVHVLLSLAWRILSITWLLDKYKSKLQWGYHYTRQNSHYKKSTNNKCWRGCGEKGPHWHWECKLVQTLWRTVWKFLKKTKNGATIWSSNPTPGHIPGEDHNLKRYTP